MINIGSLNSDLFVDIRSGLSNQMVSSHVNGVYNSYPNPAAKHYPGLPIMVLTTTNDLTPPTMSGTTRADISAIATVYSKSAQVTNEAIDKAYRVIDEMSKVSGTSALGINRLSMRSTQKQTSFIGKQSIHQKDLVITGWTIL